MRKQFVRVLSIVLVMMMLVSALPMQVLASDCDTLGHDLVLNVGKKPTYTEDGWADYYTCTRCDYTDFTILPALGEPVISDYATFIQNVAILEELAAMYVRENPGKDPAALVIKYIRTGVEKYTSGSWGIMAGYEDAGFATYVRKTEDAINAEIPEGEPMLAVTGLKNLEDVIMPNGEKYDIAHVIGTMDITYHNKGSQNHADVSGWAGDLVDLVSYIDRIGGLDLTTSFEEQIAYVREYGVAIDAADSGFDIQDVRGDFDAIAIIDKFYNSEYASGTLATIFSEYYTDTLCDEQRADFFLRNRLDGKSTRIDIREAVLDAYLKNSVVTTLESTEDLTSIDVANLRKVCCYAFADYVCALAGDYVDQIENDYYDVFSTESSTLAPGITYKKYKATTADGKQTVFYTATADITRDDVDLFANYGDTYPEHGWRMTRVLDQANAAQERYGNPESPDYIENYNVIVSTNGAGFNMQTGEPGGLLVMNGTEYHGINSNGFFGILKDGTPIIASTADYNNIYKDQVRDGIAGFGSTLIKDGKICITGTSDYYINRASRTAVGITRTGKVVLMVMDGRQEPLSCGGSMEEIAQVLFDAGCVEAVNLDGGGSTTFVARPEGEDELAVLNVPSDGIQRSVGASLLMVSTAPSSTAFDHAILDTTTDYMTVGSSINVTPVGVSATGNSAEIPEGAVFALSNSNWGTITEDGVFTAKRSGSVDIQLKLGDEIIGSKTVYIIVPDQIYFKKTNVDAVYGSSVELPLIALYEGKEVSINTSDITYTLSNDAAGSASGFTFTANATSGLKSVTLTASLAADSSVTASITVSLYNQGETTFDFDSATGGDRNLAWDRDVSNSTTSDDLVYTVVNGGEEMVTSYIFAMDMTHLTIPDRLADLTSMLPGSDLEGASAWTFLLQLAERISVLTEVKATVKVDDRFDVDYSNISVRNEYFKLKNVEYNKETNEISITLGWIDQTAAIDPDTANPLCMIGGVKLTPKDGAWANVSKINAINSGKVTYDIYMRASALYSFSQKPENQTIYGVYPFVNPDLESEKGGHFADTYTTFTDSYTLVNVIKNGWTLEDGGYAYYVNGVRTYGIALIDGYYYDFGETGINEGQTKYTGMVTVDGKKCYSSFGELVSGWQVIDGDNYYFNKNDLSMVTGVYTIDKLTYTFNDEGVLVRGAFYTFSGGVRYFWAGRHLVSRWFTIEEGTLWANNDGYVCYGIAPVIYTSSPPIWYYFDEVTGAVQGLCNGFIEYEGDTYWCDENGEVVYGVVTLDNGKKIFCATMGKVVKNASCYVGDTLDSKGGLENGAYLCDKDGYIISDGFITIDDYTYYLENYVRAKGLALIDGKYYFFNAANGNLRRNADVWVSANDLGLAAGFYHAQDDGSLLIPDLVNGEKKIVIENGNYYFTIDGVKMKSGLYELNGDYYYASSSGNLLCDKIQWVGSNNYISTGYYRFGSDCKLVKTGFVAVPGSYTYYYKDLVLAKGLTMIDGDIYLFNSSSGTMTVDSKRWISTNALGLTPGYYYFGSDGKMRTEDITVFVDGTHITVSDLIDIRDCWIARGEYTTYDEVKANVVVRVTKDSYRITPEGKFSYDVNLDGMYTVYVRLASGAVFSKIVECDTTTSVKKNIITVTDIDDSVRDITVAKGEYSVYADVKANKVFGLKSDSYRIVDGTWNYMVTENGIYTVLVRYNDGSSKYYVVECNRGDVATCTKEGNTITFSNLDNLLVLRYISGEYTSSSAMKKAGCSNIQPYKVVDGKWSVTLNRAGVYTFMTQFIDGNQVFYTITID